jgi:succinate dehydrogenase flavin-adding protein (antitoxin of CptAB toxin-antitoxin module)
MDILLGRFSEHLSDLTDSELDRYETLLDEGDQDLLAWVTGQAEAPAALTDLLTRIKKLAA